MPDPAARQWTALAFDYGHKRIGVAAGDSVTRRARPVTTLKVGGSGIDWPAIERVVAKWQPAVLVVGVPLNADGSPGELARDAQRFAPELPGFGIISLCKKTPAHLGDHASHILARTELGERIQAFAKKYHCFGVIPLSLGDEAEPPIGKTQPIAIADSCAQRNTFFQREARFVIASQRHCVPTEQV